MGFVDSWLRSGLSTLELAECVGIEVDVFREWILDYGRPSALIPGRVMAGGGESMIRLVADKRDSSLRSSGWTARGSEQRWIPVVIKERP